MHRANDEFVDIEGLQLRYRVAGDGPPLLLIQGIGASLELWQPLLDNLPGFTTIGFDHPGVGSSGTPARPVGMRDFARVAAKLLAHLEYERADVLGFSFGGMVAQELARRHPESVRRLVLVSTSCGWGSVPWGSARGAPAAMSAVVSHRCPSSAVRLVAAVLCSRAASRTFAHVRSQATLRPIPPALRGYYAQLFAASSWSSISWARKLDFPALVLCGSDDLITPIVHSRALSRQLPNAELIEVANGGHLLLVESPGAVAPHVLEFLA